MGNKANATEAPPNNGVQEFYEHISDRLSFNGKPLELLSEASVSPEQEESAKLVNGLYFKLGSLLEELAYQSADKAVSDRRYELALGEIGLVSEFVVQLAERNQDMNILPNTASEKLYRQREDDVRFWVGDFEYMGEKVDFHIMVRPKSHEVPDTIKPGIYTDSRQARLSVELLSRRYSVAFRLDPERPVCLDLVAPILKDLTFDDVNQSGAHHFYTNMNVSTGEFGNALELYASVFDSMVES